MPAFKGKKWLDNAAYITPATRDKVYRLVADYQSQGIRYVGVRPSSYIGEDCKSQVTIFGHAGSRILSTVARID